uniref:CRISPR-associated endonuclease Cas3'' n=2 Tax=Thermoflexus sp. TaxID=1969742 RepID=UPI002ADE64B3
MQPLLAKPDTLLLDHLLEVAHLGAQIAERLGLSELLRAKALLACALHDVGKATVDFQEHIRGQRKQAYPHALASMPFVLMAERLVNAALGLDPERLEATAAVLSHHSPLSARLYLGYGAPRYCPEIQTLLESLWASLSAFGIRGLPSFESLQIQQILELMRQNSPAALLDDRGIKWGRDERTLRGLLQSLPTMDFAQVKAVLHLADWLASGKRNDPGILFLSGGRAAVERHIQGLRAPLRAFQKESHDAADADVLWLRAPTGTGKTEALLLWAGDAERLIYLLPTQATANAMWRRLRRIYGEEAVSISHGRAAYMLRREADEPPLDVRLFGSAFARPVIVATLDQYLLAHLHGRHWEERRALSRRAALILDEIHAYEPYTLGLLLAA